MFPGSHYRSRWDPVVCTELIFLENKLLKNVFVYVCVLCPSGQLLWGSWPLVGCFVCRDWQRHAPWRVALRLHRRRHTHWHTTCCQTLLLVSYFTCVHALNENFLFLIIVANCDSQTAALWPSFFVREKGNKNNLATVQQQKAPLTASALKQELKQLPGSVI